MWNWSTKREGYSAHLGWSYTSAGDENRNLKETCAHCSILLLGRSRRRFPASPASVPSTAATEPHRPSHRAALRPPPAASLGDTERGPPWWSPGAWCGGTPARARCAGGPQPAPGPRRGRPRPLRPRAAGRAPPSGGQRRRACVAVGPAGLCPGAAAWNLPVLALPGHGGAPGPPPAAADPAALPSAGAPQAAGVGGGGHARSRVPALPLSGRGGEGGPAPLLGRTQRGPPRRLPPEGTPSPAGPSAPPHRPRGGCGGTAGRAVPARPRTDASAVPPAGRGGERRGLPGRAGRRRRVGHAAGPGARSTWAPRVTWCAPRPPAPPPVPQIILSPGGWRGGGKGWVLSNTNLPLSEAGWRAGPGSAPSHGDVSGRSRQRPPGPHR